MLVSLFGAFPPKRREIHLFPKIISQMQVSRKCLRENLTKTTQLEPSDQIGNAPFIVVAKVEMTDILHRRRPIGGTGG